MSGPIRRGGIGDNSSSSNSRKPYERPRGRRTAARNDVISNREATGGIFGTLKGLYHRFVAGIAAAGGGQDEVEDVIDDVKDIDEDEVEERKEQQSQRSNYHPSSIAEAAKLSLGDARLIESVLIGGPSSPEMSIDALRRAEALVSRERCKKELSESVVHTIRKAPISSDYDGEAAASTQVLPNVWSSQHQQLQQPHQLTEQQQQSMASRNGTVFTPARARALKSQRYINHSPFASPAAGMSRFYSGATTYGGAAATPALVNRKRAFVVSPPSISSFATGSKSSGILSIQQQQQQQQKTVSTSSAFRPAKRRMLHVRSTTFSSTDNISTISAVTPGPAVPSGEGTREGAPAAASLMAKRILKSLGEVHLSPAPPQPVASRIDLESAEAAALKRSITSPPKKNTVKSGKSSAASLKAPLRKPYDKERKKLDANAAQIAFSEQKVPSLVNESSFNAVGALPTSNLPSFGVESDVKSKSPQKKVIEHEKGQLKGIKRSPSIFTAPVRDSHARKPSNKVSYSGPTFSFVDAIVEPPSISKVSVFDRISTGDSSSTAVPTFGSVPTGSWQCFVCMSRNKVIDTKCASCEAEKPGSELATSASAATESAPKLLFGSSASKIGDDIFAKHAFAGFSGVSTNTSATNDRSTDSKNVVGFVKPAEGSWACDVCMSRNVAEAKACAACTADRPGTTTTTTTTVTETSSAKIPMFSFGSSSTSEATSGVTSSTAESATSKPPISFGSSNFSKDTSVSAFSFGSSLKADSKDEGAPKDSVGPKFSFGVSTKKADCTNESSSVPKFCFSGPKIDSNKGDDSATATVTTPKFSFSAPSKIDTKKDEYPIAETSSVPKFSFTGFQPDTTKKDNDALSAAPKIDFKKDSEPKFSFTGFQPDTTKKDNDALSAAPKIDFKKDSEPKFSFTGFQPDTTKKDDDASSAPKIDFKKDSEPKFSFTGFQPDTTKKDNDALSAAPEIEFRKDTEPKFSFTGFQSDTKKDDAANGSAPKFSFGTSSEKDVVKPAENGPEKSKSDFSFGGFSKPPEGSWSCGDCMSRNKASDDTCAACTASRPGAALSNVNVGTIATSTAAPKFTFGSSTIVANEKETTSSSFSFGSTDSKNPKMSSETTSASAVIEKSTFGVAKPANFAGVPTDTPTSSFSFSGSVNSKPADKKDELSIGSTGLGTFGSHSAAVESAPSAAPGSFSFGKSTSFNFGNNEASSQPSGAFTFGDKTTATASNSGVTIGSGNTMAEGPVSGGFDFSTASTSGFGFASNANAPAAVSGGGFNFGATKIPAPAETASTLASTAEASTGGFAFGGAASVASNNNTFTFGSAAPSTASGGFSFGSTPAATSGSDFAFGSSAPPTAGVSFGESQPNSNFVFGNTSNANTPSSGFSFSAGSGFAAGTSGSTARVRRSNKRR